MRPARVVAPPPPPTASRLALPRQGLRLAAYVAVTLGFALALTQLGQDSLWSDEIVTARLARYSLAGVWAGIESDPNHFPLYYLYQWAFSFAGTSEWGVRLPSAFAATLTVAAAFWLGREIHSQEAGVAAALLLATHPAHLWAAQEARYYAVVGASAALSAAGLLGLLRRPGTRPALAFVLGTLAGLYTHFFCFVMAGVETAYCALALPLALRQGRRRVATWLLANGGAIALLSAPLLPYVQRLLRTEQGGSTPMVSGATVLELWYEYGSRSDTLKYLFLALAVAGLLATFRHRPRAAVLCALWFAPVPVLACLQATHFFLAKYLYYLFPVYIVLVGAGLASMAVVLGRLARRDVAPLLLFVVLLSIPSLPTYYRSEKFNWHDAGTYLAEVAGPEDLVVTVPPTEPEMAWYYSPIASGAPVVGFGSGQQTIEPLLEAAEHARDVYWVLLLPSGSLPDVSALASSFTVTGYHGVAVLSGRLPPLESAAAILPRFAAACGSDAVLAGPAWETAGAVLEALDRPVEAQAAYSNALAFVNEERVVHRLRGDVARLAGDWAVAAGEYAAATVTAPDLPAVYLRLAEARQATGDGAGAVAAYMAYWHLTGARPAGLCVTHDLVDDLGGATVSTPGAAIDTPFCGGSDPSTCYVARTRFTLPATGETRDVLFQHPTSAVTFLLSANADDAYLVSAPLLDPQAWGWGGDGASFRVVASSSEGDAVLGEATVTAATREWQDWVLALPPATVTLRLETGPGPSGDASGDWAGWGAPLVVSLCRGQP